LYNVFLLEIIMSEEKKQITTEQRVISLEKEVIRLWALLEKMRAMVGLPDSLFDEKGR
jgi:hypothetical protein